MTTIARDVGVVSTIISPNVRKFPTLRVGHWFSPVVILLVWEIASRTGLIPERTLAAPSNVIGALAAMIVSGELPSNLLVSFERVAVGLSIGVILALVAGLSRKGEGAIDPLMQIKRTIPVVALSPVFIVWFGIGEATKVTLIALGAGWLVRLIESRALAWRPSIAEH